MLLQFFIMGLALGFSTSMPVGPVGILCIRYTLTLNFLGGLFAGLGSAVALVPFSAAVGCGINNIHNFLLEHDVLVHTIAAVLLAFMGWNIYRKTPSFQQSCIGKGKALRTAFFSCFCLTIFNPLTLLSYMAIYLALPEEVYQITFPSSLILIAGILIGALIWWFILTSLIVYLKKKLVPQSLAWINKLSGLFLILLGTGVFINAVLK